ncbi:recombinase family protein [Lysinibacillus sp. NPDC097287]|uniref:recombinase family protein n=1 Tax=Lysinibacillus sp. NPDC097287 TaxID=3364144 RepID=UPI00382798D5
MDKIALGYIRRSSHKQLENNSIEIQKQYIQEYASRKQLHVPDEYLFIDDTTSAYKKKANERKELMRLAEKMIELDISTVIFHDTSRMDRTGYSFTTQFYRPLIKKIPSLVVHLTTQDEPFDPESTAMKMNFLLSEHESVVKSEQATANLIKDLENESVYRPGARTPYGYTQKDKNLFPNENAEIVSFIFYLYSWGYSLQKIAFLLNEADIPSPKGKKWATSSIENILKNTVYTGDLTWQVYLQEEGKKHFIFENAHEPIVDEFIIELHQLNKSVQKKYGRLDTPFLFHKKVKCRDCHQVLVTQNGSTKNNAHNYQYYYYVCKKCNYKVAATEVHENLMPLILDYIHRLVLQQDFKQQTLDFLMRMNKDVEVQVLNIEKKISNLTQKTKIAQELNDRELELEILSFLEQYHCELSNLHSVRVNLTKTHQAVVSNHFFSRFHNTLTHNMGGIETRLIILYFVDYIQLSSEFKTKIQYKMNIFDEFLPTIDELPKSQKR